MWQQGQANENQSCNGLISMISEQRQEMALATSLSCLPLAFRSRDKRCNNAKKKKNAITGPRRGGSRNRAMWCSSHVTSQENAFQLYTLGYGTEEESFNNDVVLPQIPATRYYAQKECCPSEYTKQFVIMLLGTFRSQKLFVLRKPAIKNHGPQKGLVG